MRLGGFPLLLFSCALAASAGAQEFSLPLDISVAPPHRLEATGFRDVAFHFDGDKLSTEAETVDICIDTSLDDLRLQIETLNGAKAGHNQLREPETGTEITYTIEARFTGLYRPLVDGSDEVFALDFVPVGAPGCAPSERAFTIRIAPLTTPADGAISLPEAIAAHDLAPGGRYAFYDRITFTFSPAFDVEAF